MYTHNRILFISTVNILILARLISKLIFIFLNEFPIQNILASWIIFEERLFVFNHKIEFIA